jgi:hypothetical protein
MVTIGYILAAAVAWWIGMALTTAVGLGGLPFVFLAALTVALKAVGILPWSWWWAVLPVWAGLGSLHAKLWMDGWSLKACFGRRRA